MEKLYYWKKKEELARKAKEHTKLMAENYAEEIEKAVNSTVLYHGSAILPADYPNVYGSQGVIMTDSVSALFLPELAGKRVCILNFASYKNPGGMFINGSSAQEESLCHESFLYNVLKEFDTDCRCYYFDTDRRCYYAENRSHLNKGMYEDRALYTPNVRFFHEGLNNCERLADVLTCAAPNYSVALKYGNFTAEDNYRALSRRIHFVKQILAIQKPDVAILGAWGCGVFRQNPTDVAELWYQDGVPVDRTIHAIPDRPTFDAFCEVEKNFSVDEL